jgi:hypothetical protein
MNIEEFKKICFSFLNKFKKQPTFNNQLDLKKIRNDQFVNIIDFIKLDKIYIYDSNWIDIDRQMFYKANLERCFNYIRPDMYFNYLFYLIVKYDFQDKNKAIPENDTLLNIFKEISTKILRDKCNLSLSESAKLSFPWEIHHINFSKEMEDLKDSTLEYINFSSEIKKEIGINNGENPYFSDKSILFFKDLIIMGLKLSYTRIMNEINNKSFIGAEVVSNELKFYITPTGFKNLSRVNQLNRDDRSEIFFKYLNQDQNKKINTQDFNLINQLPLIIKYKDKFYYSYKIEGDFLNNFMSKRINNAWSGGLWFESQINLKELNKYRVEELINGLKDKFSINRISKERYESLMTVLTTIIKNY